MGKELIALLVVLLMTVAYSLNNSATLFSPASSLPIYNQALKTTSYIEIVRDGVGRVYPLKEVGQNHIIVNDKPLVSGDQIEYINLVEYVKPENIDERSASGMEIKRGRMNGHGLLLFGLPININEASRDDLIALSGIGEKTAQAIVKFREEKGSFKTSSELMNVRGIGRKKFKQIKGKLTI